MKTCAGTLGLGALCMIVMAAMVGITLTPALEDIKAAGLFTSLICLAGPPVLVMCVAMTGIARNAPKATAGRGGGCVATVGIAVAALVVGGILLVCASWAGG